MSIQATAKLLVELRKEHNYTQNDIAEICGVSYQAVSKWERGENLPDTMILKELAHLYNISVDELLNGVLEEKKEISIEKKEVAFWQKGPSFWQPKQLAVFFFATAIFLICGFVFHIWYLAPIIYPIAFGIIILIRK